MFGTQYGRLFTVLVHQYGQRDVTRERAVLYTLSLFEPRAKETELQTELDSKCV